jgi:glycine/D-amino acid oxidase-like deaminating enzyme
VEITVIGAGIAGLTAAIAAAEEGQPVRLLEKRSEARRSRPDAAAALPGEPRPARALRRRLALAVARGAGTAAGDGRPRRRSAAVQSSRRTDRPAARAPPGAADDRPAAGAGGQVVLLLGAALGRDQHGRGALFSGDIVGVARDRRWVSFMRSYPNFVPERPRTVRRAPAATWG